MTQPYPTLEVDLAAIARNYRLLRGTLAGGECASVVKANAYGLGVAKIAPALAQAGCRRFFVATLEEGIELRAILADAAIYVFHGARKGQAKDFLQYRLMPVLGDPGYIQEWNGAGPYALHADTGMCRLGLAEPDWRGDYLPPELVMSHLACANEPTHPKNREQLAAFQRFRALYPKTPASLANSSGIFLGAQYHFDLARPGCSLYGISPSTSLPNPMENAVRLSAPVLQYRSIAKDETVGYGATHTAKAGSVLATVELGYADGLLRALGGNFSGYVGLQAVPVVGRVSMDMVSVDVTRVPERERTPNLRITFIGKEQPVDQVAQSAGTIGYEIFTRIGPRVRRMYG